MRCSNSSYNPDQPQQMVTSTHTCGISTPTPFLGRAITVIYYPPYRTIIPYHQQAISHTSTVYRDFPPNEPYQHTIPTNVITNRATPYHTVPYHVPYHTHTVPTPSEGLNHARTQEDHAPRREHSSTRITRGPSLILDHAT